MENGAVGKLLSPESTSSSRVVLSLRSVACSVPLAAEGQVGNCDMVVKVLSPVREDRHGVAPLLEICLRFAPGSFSLLRLGGEGQRCLPALVSFAGSVVMRCCSLVVSCLTPFLLDDSKGTFDMDRTTRFISESALPRNSGK